MSNTSRWRSAGVGKIVVPKTITQDEALAVARADASIGKFITGEPKKVIFVAGRLLNVVV